MADRFPTLEEIDAGQAAALGDVKFDPIGDAPESDFLARERALLGDDADQFTTPDDHLATVEDGGDDDLLGVPGSFKLDDAGNVDIAAFESSFPAIDVTNEQVAPGGTITGTKSLLSAQPSTAPSYVEDEVEPEVLKAWRERRDLAVQHRDQVSEERQAQTVKAAREAIDSFYENYNNKKDKSITQTRAEAEEFLKNREDTVSGGTSWERIAKLVDLSGKGPRGGGSGTGKERFRELLLSLRKDEKAPGAGGY